MILSAGDVVVLASKYQRLIGHGIAITDVVQVFGVMSGGVIAVEYGALIAKIKFLNNHEPI